MDNYTLTYDSELKLSKWVGYPDADYSWEGERLSYERTVKDEEGKERTVKTYKDPIEITADFKAESKVLLASDEIEIAVAKQFGPLKGFVWLEKVKGGGEVVLPFTAPHIFIASDRLNPVLTEIFTDPNSDNYYEIIEGKTRVFVKSFSGVGGAAGAPPTLIAHYKMNDNAANVIVVDETGNHNGTFVDNAVGAASFTGAGLDDMASGGDFTGTEQLDYKIEIDGEGIPDTFKWSDDGGSTWDATLVAITGAAQTLNNGVTVTFTATTGHTATEYWTFTTGNPYTNAHDVQGKINGALDFDGTYDYIDIADHSDFEGILNFSISGWFYFDVVTGYIYLVRKQGIFNLRLYNTKKLSFQIYNASGPIIAESDTELSTGQWYHLVGTYNGVEVKIYVNGELKKTGTGAGTGVLLTSSYSIIISGDEVHNYLHNGLIDNVMFFGVELTPDEVKRIYSNGHGTEILADLDQTGARARRSGNSPMAMRQRYEH